MNSYRAWDVYLNGELINTVFFLKNITKNQVRLSLIKHDGYDANIILVREDI